MALTAATKAEIVKEYQLEEGDTGSPEVQVALLTHNVMPCKATSRITTRTTTLVMVGRMVNQRRKLLTI